MLFSHIDQNMAGLKFHGIQFRPSIPEFMELFDGLLQENWISNLRPGAAEIIHYGAFISAWAVCIATCIPSYNNAVFKDLAMTAVLSHSPSENSVDAAETLERPAQATRRYLAGSRLRAAIPRLVFRCYNGPVMF